MTSRKKPYVAFWATVVVVAVLMLAYPLSYPWTCALLIGQPELQSRLIGPMQTFYTPLGWVLALCPENIQECYTAYNNWSLRIAGVPLDF